MQFVQIQKYQIQHNLPLIYMTCDIQNAQNINLNSQMHIKKQKPSPQNPIKNSMHHTQHSKISISLSNKDRTCVLCNKNYDISSMTDHLLIKKYSELRINQDFSSEFNHFFQGRSVLYKGGVKEFLMDYSGGRQFVKLYYPINRIKYEITNVVKKNAIGFKNQQLQFRGSIYQIFTKIRNAKGNQDLYSNQKQQKTKPYDAEIFNNSFIKYVQGNNSHVKKSKINENYDNFHFNINKSKTKILNVDQSTSEIKKLCKKIGFMCGNFQNEKMNKKFKSQLQTVKVKNNQNKNAEAKFKNNLQNKISIIKKSPSKSKQKLKKFQDSAKQIQQIYGISDKKIKKKSQLVSHLTIQNRPYQKKRAQTQKAEIIPDSPVSQAYYTKQFNYTQTAGPIRTKRKSKLHTSTSASKKDKNKLVSFKLYKSISPSSSINKKSIGKKEKDKMKKIC